MFVGYLKGVRASRDRQSYYSLGVHLISIETDKGGFEWTKFARVYLQLLEGGEVNDVGRAPIVY